jgi:hypothetical protein
MQVMHVFGCSSREDLLRWSMAFERWSLRRAWNHTHGIFASLFDYFKIFFKHCIAQRVAVIHAFCMYIEMNAFASKLKAKSAAKLY